ncbi:MAG: hypothetical protein K9J27_04305 [Bacteroidales bacterium]|nr:hypothetical protein [Bacteroidales bacterium]MCF8332969.1 hypothetical protein [Bacteroidales bacterium]
MKRIITLFIITTFVVACEPEIDDFEPSSGEADFSTYVAVGNSLTAGFMNGELYRSGQQNSYPSMLADKFATVGGGDFTQPLMKDDLGFGNRRVLGPSQDCTGDTSLAPVPIQGEPNPQNFTSIADQGPFNNMGVPGAKSFHLVAEGYGQLNPYFGRFMSDPNTTVLADAMAANPTFFTMWIGNNDVLGYAMAGGEADSITGQQMYGGVLQSMLQTLTSIGAKGAIANIPDITDIPFFNTIPYNALTLSQEQAQQLNQSDAYQQYNQGAENAGVDKISFQEGANALVIEDNSAPYNQIGGIRQIKENELVLLEIPLDSVKCYGMGSQNPVPEEYVLDEEEISKISQAVNGYNQTITAMAQQFSIAEVDMAAVMKEAEENGLRYDGVGYTTEFVSGGLFSLDGIHLTGQGYAIVANKFISAINAEYNAEIPTVSVTDYSGIQFP